jgi:signal transduction histidine kinase
MKLRVKVAAVVSIATAAAGLLVGAGVLQLQLNSSMGNLAGNLERLVLKVQQTKDDPLSFALNEVKSKDITLAYMQEDGKVTILQSSAGSISSPTVLRRWVNLGFGERLIFGVSQNSILQARDNAFWWAVSFVATASMFTGLVAWLLMARDLKLITQLIEDAKSIAGGKSVTITKAKGSRELGELSGALSEMVQQLQDSKNQMQTFLSDASHELRTPLTVIRGYLEILAKGVDSEQASRAVDRAQNSAMRMQKLITDLLTLAELGELPDIHREPLRFSDIYGEMVEDLKNAQPKRKITLQDSQSTDFEASRELITQFFANAFANLRAHTAATAKLRISVVQTPVGVQLDFEDAGPGIPTLTEENSQTVFKRFDENRVGGSQSSGLGLSIMAKVIELHGGELRLSRSELGGLRVSAFLPAE